ncbi:MAG: hypothetical protein WCJ18_05605 [Planctomycetota bacterium]
MKILILGSRGNLGQDLVAVFSAASFPAVINAVAYSNADGAEDPASRPIAWKLNAEVPGELARAARKAGAAPPSSRSRVVQANGACFPR